MASGPITSWEIDGETVETVSDFILLGSKITADGDFSHEIKICLFNRRNFFVLYSFLYPQYLVKITADGDFSHEIKGRLLFGRKVMTNLDTY